MKSNLNNKNKLNNLFFCLFFINFLLIWVYFKYNREIIINIEKNWNIPKKLIKDIIIEPRIFEKYVFINKYFDFQDIIYDKVKNYWNLNLKLDNENLINLNDNSNYLQFIVLIKTDKDEIKFNLNNKNINLNVNVNVVKKYEDNTVIKFNFFIKINYILIHLANNLKQSFLKNFIYKIINQLENELKNQNNLRLKYLN